MFFHHDYLDEAIDSEASEGPDGVGVFVVTMESGGDPTRIMADIDGLFENGPQAVQTTTEAEFQRQFVTMMGSVPTLINSIGGGVLFAILLAAVNTMIMAGRERTHQLGILKALGFGDGIAFGLLLFESMLLCLLGGGMGVGLAVLTGPAFGQVMSTMFPYYVVTPEAQMLGIGVAFAVGLLAGILPAWNAMRLKPVEALRLEV